MILIAATARFDARSVAGQLTQTGFEADLIELPLRGDLAAIPTAHAWVALIEPKSDLTWLGTWVERLRRRVDGARELVVCCPQLSEPDRSVLFECGASRVVTPTEFQTVAVTERLLAELILAGQLQPDGLGGLRGATPRMQDLYRRIGILAPVADPVLILGETGTGKELVARELHRLSGRKGNLLAVNVGEFTKDLVESELFGHQRGAFTGALQRRGLLLEAGAGTLFLDEIGDLPWGSQVKLLRVLDEMKVRPVGANTWEPFRARVVLATNCDLEAASSAGEFRQDLLERLKAFTLKLPPLRDRKADIPALVEHFVTEHNQQHSCRRSVPPAILDVLFRHRWPGNVRELRGVVRAAATYADREDGPINSLHILDSLRAAPPAPVTQSLEFDPLTETWRTVHDRIRLQYFRSLLVATGGRKIVALERSGLQKTQFYKLLSELELVDKGQGQPEGDL